MVRRKRRGDGRGNVMHACAYHQTEHLPAGVASRVEANLNELNVLNDRHPPLPDPPRTFSRRTRDKPRPSMNHKSDQCPWPRNSFVPGQVIIVAYPHLLDTPNGVKEKNPILTNAFHKRCLVFRGSPEEICTCGPVVMCVIVRHKVCQAQHDDHRPGG